MPDETMIFGVSEEGPNGDALGFIDLARRLITRCTRGERI